MIEPNEWYTNSGFGSWPDINLCWPGGLPYELTYSLTGIVDGQYCIQILNDRDTYWLTGTHYLCSKVQTPYGSDVILKYRYAAPHIDRLIQGNGTSAGLVTVIGTSFGYNISNSLTIDSQPCYPLYVWTHTTVVCAVPGGLGTGKDLVIDVEGQLSNIVRTTRAHTQRLEAQAHTRDLHAQVCLMPIMMGVSFHPSFFFCFSSGEI